MILPSTLYQARVQAGLMQPDAAQTAALPALDALVQAVLAAHAPKNIWQKLWGGGHGMPAGAYLYGPVGRGKSFLMDLVFESIPAPLKKKRLHFYAFMRDVHHRLQAARQRSTADPLRLVVNEIRAELDVLCFDEMFVKDVADAMILERLFAGLTAKGLVVLFTSNLPPDDLYKDGLQRVRFMPFIAWAKKHLVVLPVMGAVDHRRARLQGEALYYTPLGPAASQMLQHVFKRLTVGFEPEPYELLVEGRILPLQQVAGDVLKTDFDELCTGRLGPSDMLDIAARFSCVIMDDVPALKPEQRNETLRFIMLVDALYDARRTLVLAAAVPLEALCDKNSTLAFDFNRTISRIIEMQAADYQNNGMPT